MTNIYQTPTSSLSEQQLASKRNAILAVIRWCLLPIACVGAWFVTCLAVAYCYSSVEKILDLSAESVFGLFGLAGPAVVLTAYWVAPSKKLVVASSAYAFGASICLVIILSTLDYNALGFASAVAVVLGAVTLAGLFYRASRKKIA